MIAGLPGTGIGGIFYMLMALYMPLNEITNKIKGHKNSNDKMPLVRKHMFLNFSVILAVIITGWLAGWLAILILFGIHDIYGLLGIYGANPSNVQVENFLQIAPIILTFLTLLAVHFAMHVLRLAIRVHKFFSAQ